MALIELTDIDDGEHLGIFEMTEETIEKLDEIFCGSEISWKRIDDVKKLDEAGLREFFQLPACDHAPQEHLRGGCVCGWKRGG